MAGVLPQALAALDEGTLTQLEGALGQLIQRLGAGDSGAKTPLADLATRGR